MLYPGFRSSSRGKFYAALGDDLHFTPKPCISFQNISKDLFIAVVTINIRVIKGCNASVERSLNELFNF